jgi:shikimate kinase
MGKTIFLVGFMGSGKSTLGKKLATHFNAAFIDLDTEIEKQAGKSITSIFEMDGEAFFREKEKDTLRNLPDKEILFVATGGGTPCFHENMEWMKSNGVVIYLNLPTSILIGRLKENKAHRPLIKNLNGTELSEYVSQKLEERNPFYEKADILVNHNKSLPILKAELNLLLHI